MSDYLITNNKEHIDLTTAMSLLSITDKKDVLWSWLHRYGENYVPTDTTNAGWNALGLCIIYYKETLINNQPTRFGQLINIPADTNYESMQLFIEQNTGGIWKRGGNATIAINDLEFDTIAFNNRHNIENQFTINTSNTIGVTALDGSYNGSVTRTYTVPRNGIFHGWIYGTAGQVIVYLNDVPVCNSNDPYGSSASCHFHIPVRAGQVIRYSSDSGCNQTSYNNWLFDYFYNS